jgi:oligoribonuclease (3'-5' exoribonuclease)
MVDEDLALAWMDVETNGISEKECSLLEIAVFITDWDLNLLEPNGFQREILYTPEEVKELQKDLDPYVLEMHTKTGLWDKLPTGTPLKTVEQELLAYMKQYNPQPRTARLAGNSVSLDARFLNEYLPSVYNHLHYRIMDVSSLAGLSRKWYNLEYPKKGTHNAFQDINESIEELKYYRQTIFK